MVHLEMLSGTAYILDVFLNSRGVTFLAGLWELVGGWRRLSVSQVLVVPVGELEQTVGMKTGFWGQRQVEETRRLSVGILAGHWEKWSGSSQVVV